MECEGSYTTVTSQEPPPSGLNVTEMHSVDVYCQITGNGVTE